MTPEAKVRKASRQDVGALRWLAEKVEIPFRRIAEAARKGLMALCVQVGLAVLQATMENEVAELVGPKGKHWAHRQAYRHGYEAGRMVFGGRKVHVECPRVRRKAGGEVRLESHPWAQQEDSLNEAVLARLLHGVATALWYVETRFRRLGGHGLIPLLQEALCRELGLEQPLGEPALVAW